MKIIAIVGFGFCGRLAFHHLVKKADENTKILIFEKNNKDDLGTAFSAFSPHYILNVPAIKMSAFSDQPRNFCEFLEKKYPQVWQEIGENGFAPRQIYGEYLDQITKEAFVSAKDFEFINEEVLGINTEPMDPVVRRGDKLTLVTPSHNGVHKVNPEFFVKTKSGKSFNVDEILLATSFTQSNLPFNFESKNLVKKLWDKNSLQFHQKNLTDEKICLIGSGLTAVDIIVGLKKKNFQGKIFVISRRGNFPKKHFQIAQTPAFAGVTVVEVEDAKKGALFLCLKIRNFLRKNPQLDLRHVIDSIRPITVKLWQNFDEKNKKLFFKLMPYWNIFRHRAPISSVELIEEMIESGQLVVKKKGVKNIVEESDKILVQTKSEEIECNYVVNCLGFEFNAKKYPLFAQMIDADLLKKDLMLAQSNHPQIHLLGGLNIGRDFECTAVPDLRISVEKIVLS